MKSDSAVIPYVKKQFLSPPLRQPPAGAAASMAMTHYQFQQLQQQQQLLQQQQQQQQEQQQYKPFRNLYTLDGEISPPIAFFDGGALLDQSHPPYVPQFHVAGSTPGPVAASGGEDGCGGNMPWEYGSEQKKRKLKEQDFLENNFHLSSNFLQARKVSTGLELSLDNTNRWGSSGEVDFLSIVGDEIDQELRRQNAEINRYLKIQGDRLRQDIVEKVQADKLQSIAYIEEKGLLKLRAKEAEVENCNQRNMELEEKMEHLVSEAAAWKERAKYAENMITFLKFNLQQVYAQSRDSSKDGCGGSNVEDTSSCCNGQAVDFHLMKDTTCKICRVKEACMFFLPCKHLCLCKDCESNLSACPICQCSKIIAMEIFM
ncbi:hypothetical protein Nepgr_015661 [Nepenthes gracilis]|uniref:RING-type domain-containing protein n=1 Tax=Nepenthes gracilis TaxID=150966 RepID=A0AAD3SLE0_NEPGR|nr:hypothetical protein Nepgr_015661 [Nepenthes gracilis]